MNENRLTGALPQKISAEHPLLASREDQRHRLANMAADEIAATLGAVEGVLEARVHLNLPPVDPLFGQPAPGARGSASVLIIAEQGKDILSKEEVAQLVQGAAGISPEAIAVLVHRSEPQRWHLRNSEAVTPAPAASALTPAKTVRAAAGLLLIGAGLLATLQLMKGKRDELYPAKNV